MAPTRPSTINGLARNNPELDWFAEEGVAWAHGTRCICGIDEAGRGCLAGPVVAACVVLPYGCKLPGVTDSKLLSPAERDRQFELIQQVARGIGIGTISAQRVDEINILRASHEAMRVALANLLEGLQPDLALIDGLPVKPFPINQIALVKGDGRCLSIAAASIIAKVTRDRLMIDADLIYPGYGFASNKGYGAPIHLNALASHGPTSIHRLTFKPVAVALEAHRS